MRSALILLAACSGSAAPALSNTATPPTKSGRECSISATHSLPAFGSSFTELPAGWVFPDAPDGRAGNGVVAHMASDEQAGQGAMLFVLGENPSRYLGALGPPGEYMLAMDHVCPDGFVIAATTAGPPTKYVRVTVDAKACSVGEWQLAPPAC